MASVSAQGLPRDKRVDIIASVVQIVPWDAAAGLPVDWSGSGTVISPSGYVLTNYHVIGDLELRRAFEWHAVYWTDPDFTDQPPTASFWARFVAGDPTHDLALLKIEQWIDETPIDASVTFPHVSVGDSNSLLPGDPINIVGYPGISGGTITFTSGLMSGWLGEDFESGGKQWIKTDGKISHGNSGGGAFDASGYLIGVPTAGRTVEWAPLDVEAQAYVRPISLAWALIGPHVTDVTRSGTTGTTATFRGNEAQATCDHCFAGTLEVGGHISSSIRGMPSPVNYHTYVLKVPAGLEAVVVDLSSASDLDVAIKHGQPIQDWSEAGDWQFRDFSDELGATIRIPAPAAGDWYVDVIYFYEQGTPAYDLRAW